MDVCSLPKMQDVVSSWARPGCLCLQEQVRECATALLHVAKGQGIPMFLVGHVTKTGDIAGLTLLAPLCCI